MPIVKCVVLVIIFNMSIVCHCMFLVVLKLAYLLILNFKHSVVYSEEECCYGQNMVEDKLVADEWAYQAYLAQAKWPDNKVYYDVDPHLDPVIRHYLAKAITYFNEDTYSCVTWEQYSPVGSEDPTKHWVTFVQIRDQRSGRVFSNIGWNLSKSINTHVFLGYKHAENTLSPGAVWGKNKILVPPEKDKVGNIYMSSLLHEMMHVMGFRHEHQRGDRDCYIFVSDEYVGKMKIFTNWSSFFSPYYPYDTDSVMHYPENYPHFYPHDYKRNLRRIDGKYSEQDLWKINYVYCNQPGWCELYTDCSEELYKHQFDPNCFREGPKYNNTKYSCTKCDWPSQN